MEGVAIKASLKTKKIKMPHVFVILTFLLFLASLMTYFVPAGEFGRVLNEATGKQVIDPLAFKFVSQNPINILKIPEYIVKSLVKSSGIIFMVMISAASMEVIIATKSFDIAIKKMIKKFTGKEELLIIATIIIFSIMGLRQNSMSMVGFIPLVVLLSRKCGYDALTGVAIILLGAGGSYSIGPLATSTTAIAQGFAELPTFSGFAYRIICVICLLIVSTYHILKYSKNVKKDPRNSYIYELEEKYRENLVEDENEEEDLKLRHIGVLIVFFSNFIILAYGGMFLGWSNLQVASQFIFLTLIGGLVGGLVPDDIAKNFSKGISKMTVAGFMIGMAGAISMILNSGMILDTVVKYISSAISIVPNFLQPVAMYMINCIVNLFITSGSGQAAAVMPIFIPVADLVGMTRQTAVLAFNYGDGLSNFLIPTSSALMGCIMAAGIPYDRWMKFMGKVFLSWSIVSSITLSVAYFIKLGPF